MNTLISETIDGEIVRHGKLDAQDCEWWAKRNCRRCHGRGVLHFSHPSGIETVTACSCVSNRMGRADTSPSPKG